jgi:SAM-dependent methyltransferase
MYLVDKCKNIYRKILQSWGSAWIKRKIWNKEFLEGRWNILEDTPTDSIYSFLDKYAHNSDILDLGCGSGNTGNELNFACYRSYTGVDISDVAIQKAIERSEANSRGAKNRYFQSDIAAYEPQGKYQIILFRESLNYIPHLYISDLLHRYQKYLDEQGVFIVRLYDPEKYKAIIELVRKNFHVIEEFIPEDMSVSVLVFR